MKDDILDRLSLIIEDSKRLAPMAKYRPTLEAAYNELLLSRRVISTAANKVELAIEKLNQGLEAI
jgi:hypothetical protein